MEVKKPSRQRRSHKEEFKQAVVEACCEPGVSVAGIALANGVNANQVRRWMRERGLTPPSRREEAGRLHNPEWQLLDADHPGNLASFARCFTFRFHKFRYTGPKAAN